MAKRDARGERETANGHENTQRAVDAIRDAYGWEQAADPDPKAWGQPRRRRHVAVTVGTILAAALAVLALVVLSAHASNRGGHVDADPLARAANTTAREPGYELAFTISESIGPRLFLTDATGYLSEPSGTGALSIGTAARRSTR
jgi:hypothetical protein